MGTTNRNNMPLSELLGEKLVTKDGEKNTDEVLAGKKNILVYFSAHWCPPCRGYTPDLSAAYEGSSKKDETAVVFVSSDRDQEAFDEYYASMSFFAVPFAARDIKETLGNKYGVRGIPTLVHLDGEGNTVEGNVRGRHGEFL